MNALKFVFKLLKHGGIFALRLVGILTPLVGSSIAAFTTAPRSKDVSNEADQFADFPDLSDVTHLNWDATYGHSTKR